jgi:hypothetical protein
MQQQSTIETIKVQGNQLLKQVERLIHEGNVRRIVVKQEGQTVAEFPLTLGVVGAIVAPVLAAAGAMAALLTDCSIEVERIAEPAPPAQEDQPKELSAPEK